MEDAHRFSDGIILLKTQIGRPCKSLSQLGHEDTLHLESVPISTVRLQCSGTILAR